MRFRSARVLLCSLLFALPALAADAPTLQQGLQLYEQGRFAEARTALLPFASAKPPDAQAAFCLGRIALRTDDGKEAERWFEPLVKREDSNPIYHLWLGRAYGTQAQSAGKLSQFGLAKKTKAEFERASTLDPNNLDAREDLISYYLEAPGFMGGGVDKAKAEATEIRRRDALRGALAGARVAEHEKDLAGAEREYQAAIRSAPDSVGIRYALGIFYARTAQYDRAFATFDEMLKVNPGETGALYQIGRTGALSGQQLDRAEAALQQCLAAPASRYLPRPAPIHWRLGTAYEKHGKKELARAEYQKALALDPDMAEAKKGLARVKG